MAGDSYSTISAVEVEVANVLGFGHVHAHSETQHEAVVVGAQAAIDTWADIRDDDPTREPRTRLEELCAAFIDAHEAREAAAA